MNSLKPRLLILIVLLFFISSDLTISAENNLQKKVFNNSYWKIEKINNPDDFYYYYLKSDGTIEKYNPWINIKNNEKQNIWFIEKDRIIFKINNNHSTYTSDKLKGNNPDIFTGDAIDKYKYSWKWKAQKVTDKNLFGRSADKNYNYIEINKSNDSSVLNEDGIKILSEDESFISQCRGIQKIAYIELSNLRSTVTYREAKKIAFKNKGEFISNTKHNNKDAYLITKIIGIPDLVLKKEMLKGTWTRFIEEKHSWYPGTIKISDDFIEYKSHYQDIYSKFYKFTFSLDNDIIKIGKIIDLWPENIKRGIDPNFNKLENDKFWKIIPIQTDSFNNIIAIIIEHIYYNYERNKKSIIRTIYKKISNDPEYIIKTENNHLN
ncbi:MAG: hypothetical protein JXB50_12830 [Spirochaetes bacterium]|nr:hypothetical protein [Spirochaetota bacterium]